MSKCLSLLKLGKSSVWRGEVLSKSCSSGLRGTEKSLLITSCLTAPAVTNSLLHLGADFRAHVMNDYSGFNDSTAWTQ